MEERPCRTDIDINSLDLDTTVKMVQMSYSLELWEELVKFSESLHMRAKSIISNVYDKESICYNYRKRPLVYYYGYGLLMKGIALKKHKRFEEAKLCIQQYSDLGWFPDLNQAGQEAVQYFKFISEPNIFEIDLLSGNMNVLDRYVEFIQTNPTEILPGLITILEVANIYDVDIDGILQLFADPIDGFKKYNQPDVIEYAYSHLFLFELTKYLFHKSNYYAAIESTLEMLMLVHKTESTKIFKRAISFFELLREYATSTQKDKYKSILLKGAMSSEKGIDLNDFIHSIPH